MILPPLNLFISLTGTYHVVEVEDCKLLRLSHCSDLDVKKIFHVKTTSARYINLKYMHGVSNQN